MSRVPLPVIGRERPLVGCPECGRWCTYARVVINVKIGRGVVPRALRPVPAATPRTARAARRRAVARKARI